MSTDAALTPEDLALARQMARVHVRALIAEGEGRHAAHSRLIDRKDDQYEEIATRANAWNILDAAQDIRNEMLERAGYAFDSYSETYRHRSTVHLW